MVNFTSWHLQPRADVDLDNFFISNLKTHSSIFIYVTRGTYLCRLRANSRASRSRVKDRQETTDRRTNGHMDRQTD